MSEETDPRPVEGPVSRAWAVCPTHGPDNPRAWGCPECLAILRDENAKLRALLYDAAPLAGPNSAEGLQWMLDVRAALAAPAAAETHRRMKRSIAG